MGIETIIGQPLAVKLVERWLTQKTNHPLLFYGPAGVGKRTLAIELAKSLNCQNKRGTTACNQCNPCKKITGGKHPDVRLLDRSYQALVRDEPLEKQQYLRIETILDERKRLYQSAVEGEWKVSLLDESHRLTPDAANVLLKVLEEPPARTAIILLTPYRDRLFSTLVSRCQPVRFRPLSDKEMRDCLLQLHVPVANQPRLIELAAGSPGLAVVLQRPDQLQTAAQAGALWTQIPQLTPEKILSRSEGRARDAASQRADIEQQLEYLLPPAQRELRSGQSAAARKITLIQEAQRQLRQNVPAALVMDHLLLQLSRLSATR